MFMYKITLALILTFVGLCIYPMHKESVHVRTSHTREICINGKPVKCFCGNDPVLVVCINGKYRGFCKKHMHERRK